MSHAYAEPGLYEAVLGAYDGDVTSKDSREVRVHRRPSSIVVLSADGLTGEDVIVRAQLLDGFEPRRPMGGKLVQLFAKEATLYLTTNAKGVATGLIPFNAGANLIQASYAGDTYYLVRQRRGESFRDGLCAAGRRREPHLRQE